MAESASPRYVAPGWFTRTVFNPSVAFLTRAGFSVWGSRELRVRGRTSGEWRTTPVNLLSHDGERYLVAPRGETQWVKNLRAAGEGVSEKTVATIMHSDRGTQGGFNPVLRPPIESAQYTARAMVQAWADAGLRRSMGVTAICWDKGLAS